MQITRLKIQYLWPAILILVPTLAWLLSSGHIVAAVSYMDSGHGNCSYGVNRSGIDTPCPTGDCTHCHDTFDDSICGVRELMLFAANDTDLSFKSHDSTTNYATTPIVNRTYSYRAGGWTADTVDNILEAFSFTSPGASHDLDDIKTFIDGMWGYTADSNSCTACHSQHRAQGDPENSPNAAKTSATRGWPVTRPTKHGSLLSGDILWGDDIGERMSDYTTEYQALYRYNSTTTYEPDGSTTQDGSNLTDYATFCTDCHNATNAIYSNTLERNVKTIDWDNEKHGKGDADGYIKVDSPYSSTLGKVLSCLDCHEPHGAPNVTLIRKEVNRAELAGTIATITSTDCTPTYNDNNTEMKYLCTRCHNDDFKGIHHDTYNNDGAYRDTNCNRCHESGGGGGHGGHDGGYRDGGYRDGGYGDWDEGCSSCHRPINCNCCHYHGSIQDDCDYEPSTRRTFQLLP